VSVQPETPAGRQLYTLLPEVYRSRDNGDLAALVDGLGHLLGQVRETLEQRLADSFPDEPRQGRACQPWLLPYFAELVGARLVSPEPSGQRAEVANAIAWRQVKGTPASVEQVAQEVGRFEVETQEGWKRIAVTPRTGWPLPRRATGKPGEDPFAVDRPSGTVAIGLHARSLRVDPKDPEARLTRFSGQALTWRQANPHGAPCFPGSYEDPSARTADLRSPDWRKGHAHPRRLLLYHPPPSGFFLPGVAPVDWADWGAGVQELDQAVAALEASGQVFLDLGGGRGIKRVEETPVLYQLRQGQDVQAERTVAPDGAEVTRLLLSGHWLEQRALPNWREIRSLGVTVPIEGDVALPGTGTWSFAGLAFLDKVDAQAARLVLRDAAVDHVVSNRPDVHDPAVDAASSLIRQLTAADGLVRLEYVTVLGRLEAKKLQASDSILNGEIIVGLLPKQFTPGCVRYSRVDAGETGFSSAFNTPQAPIFFEPDFGKPGCGVLHPATPRSIRFGAEDGGEMGAYHDRRYALAVEAVRTKLEDFLPLGLQAVLIPDLRLLAAPPKPQSS